MIPAHSSTCAPVFSRLLTAASHVIRAADKAQMFPEKDISAFRSSDHEIRPVRQIRMSQSFISVMLNAPATYTDA